MTKCPVCKNVNLRLSSYDNNLPVSECSSCGGAWLRANEYARWLKTQTPGKYDLSKSAEVNSLFQINESNQASICPDCGRFLRRFKVASSLDFHLDRCNSCNGVWLDQNEWQSLKAVDLHDEIHQIFTQPWQKLVQDEITASKYDRMYSERLGESDYEKVKALRKWLQENPNGNMLIAYLLDKDPYSA